MVLMSVISNGTVIGQCDERCYGSSGNECDCVCGGKNHGKGLLLATINTRLSGDALGEEWANAHILDGRPYIVAVQSDVAQMSIFEAVTR